MNVISECVSSIMWHRHGCGHGYRYGYGLQLSGCAEKGRFEPGRVSRLGAASQRQGGDAENNQSSGNGENSAVSVRTSVARHHPATAARDGRFLPSVSRHVPAILTGLAVVLVGADAFAAGGNAIAQMLNSVVDNATMCGGAIATLAACGAEARWRRAIMASSGHA